MTTNTNFPTAYPSTNDRSTNVSLEQGQNTPLAQTATSGENRPKQIKLARPNDDEVIIIGAFDVSNLACDFSGIADTLHDISQLLSMIYRDEITHEQAKAMARISQSTVETWCNASHASLNRLNAALKQSSFGEVQA